jgi:hypothetical protein
MCTAPLLSNDRFHVLIRARWNKRPFSFGRFRSVSTSGVAGLLVCANREFPKGSCWCRLPYRRYRLLFGKRIFWWRIVILEYHCQDAKRESKRESMVGHHHTFFFCTAGSIILLVLSHKIPFWQNLYNFTSLRASRNCPTPFPYCSVFCDRWIFIAKMSHRQVVELLFYRSCRLRWTCLPVLAVLQFRIDPRFFTGHSRLVF